ncbi:MAG TPA: sugar phosphate nucleotidyltransferase [Acidimicrobiia bacterium]
MSELRPVILSGGSGTRLWPLSSPGLPKQFAPLLGNETLFARTIARLQGVAGPRPTIVAAGVAHLDMIRAAVEQAGVDATILVEPAARNTAPAIFAAALLAEPDEVLVILPSDHLIAEVPGFQEAVVTAATIAKTDVIVTFGIPPTRAETGYGYIEKGEPSSGGFLVRSFVEKPSPEVADSLAGDGRHLWNSGMFVAPAGLILEEASEHCPEVLAGVKTALPAAREGVVRLGAEFASVEAVSFDYAVMEKTTKAVVVPLDVGWDDVGSYVSLLAAGEVDGDGNLVSGDVRVRDVSGSFVKATSRRLVVVGLDRFVVVETPDAVLVMPLDRAQEVRDLQLKGEEE